MYKKLLLLAFLVSGSMIQGAAGDHFIAIGVRTPGGRLGEVALDLNGDGVSEFNAIRSLYLGGSCKIVYAGKTIGSGQELVRRVRKATHVDLVPVRK